MNTIGKVLTGCYIAAAVSAVLCGCSTANQMSGASSETTASSTASSAASSSVQSTNIPSAAILSPSEGLAVRSGTIDASGTAVVGSPDVITAVRIFMNGSFITNAGYDSNSGVWSNAGLTLLSNRTNTLLAQAVSGNGRTNDSAAVNVIMDTVLPVVLLSLTNNQLVGGTYMMSGTASDVLSGISNIYVNLDGGAYFSLGTNSAWQTNFIMSVVGKHTNSVYAVDRAGNSSYTNKVIVEFTDMQPSVIITNLLSAVTTNIITITAAGSAGIGVFFSIQSIDLEVNGIYQNAGSNLGPSCTWSCNLSLNANSTNTVRARVIGTSGLTNYSATVRIVSDTVPPVISNVSPASGSETGSNYIFSGSAGDNFTGVSAVYARLDNGVYMLQALSNGGWSTDYTVSYGLHTNYAYALDAAGNQSAVVTNMAVYPAVPSVVISSFTDLTVTNSQAVSISGTASVASPYVVTKVMLSTNGSGYFTVSGTANWTASGLNLEANSTNTVRAAAAGSSGKTNYSDLIRIVIDTEAPAISGMQPADNSEVGSNYTFSGSAGDNFTGVSAVYARLDNGGYALQALSNGGWSADYTVSYGLHTNYAFAVDKAGNVSATITNRVFYKKPDVTYTNGNVIYLMVNDNSWTVLTNTGNPSGSLTILSNINGFPVTSIGDYAFYCCYLLTGSLTIPSNITVIGQHSFDNCYGLTGSLTIPSGVTNIGAYAFYYCNGFTGGLTIPASVVNIGAYAFYDCTGFTGGLTISSGVTNIGDYAFSYCTGFTGGLTIPASVVNIGNNAFYSCTGFTGGLTISSGVINIGDYAFHFCTNFTGSLTIPSGVTNIGNYAFSYCAGFNGGLTIPASVVNIGNNAFYNCKGFTGGLTIPAGVANIGNYAFFSCSNFTGSLTISSGVTNIGNNAFNSCINFTGSLTIPDGVSNIGSSTFNCCSNFSGGLTIPASVASIGSSAFRYCSKLTGSLIIPPGVTNIGSYAFYNCSGFTGSLTISSNIRNIGTGVFYECRNLTGSLTIPTGVANIGGYAFYECFGFTGSLTIPDGVTNIGDYAFYNCYGLTGSLRIPDSVSNIGYASFNDCLNIGGNLTISSGITNIGSTAFIYCSGITNVYENAAVPPVLDGSEFLYCSPLTVFVPAACVGLYNDAWTNFLPAGSVITNQ